MLKKILKKNILTIIYKKLRNMYLGNIVICPKLLQIKKTDRILVLAPHPDDESIGCGGLLLKYASQCKVVCLTDGRFGDPNISISELINIRKQEFINAMNFVKVKDYQFSNVQDGNLLNEFDSFNKISFDNFDYIFIPNILDQHLDHKAVGIHLSKILKSKKTKVKICLYEVWNALALPNSYINISDIVESKKELVSLYKSQTKHIDYQNKILSLNNYRGMSVGIEYAEVYSCIKVDEFLEIMK
jgi:LmbE family N-acetylglucosaminyl deacetylase